ncbi:hypothetical protein [Variovorax rhizosphaerae]|uniref:Uncharacterized protein n=1 Tax=Variovorax rhizosphaerae TaxID=1836200 RepID=A0ABU8WSF5_9BURK
MTETTQPAQFFTKAQAARWQLDRAIALYLDEGDYVCAISLAGAADEILGKLLKEGQDVEISKADAIEMLDRAVGHFLALEGTESPLILRYMARGAGLQRSESER